MVTKDHGNRPVTDAQRRRFLKLLGVGTAGAVGITLSDVTVAAEDIDDSFAEVGEAIRADVADDLDGELIAEGQSELANAATELPTVPAKGHPDEVRDDYSSVAAPGWEVYEHLVESDFFLKATNYLPDYDVDFVESTLEGFVNSDHFMSSLAEVGLSDDEGIDLLATVVDRAETLSEYHWVGHEEIRRHNYEAGPSIGTMTQLSSGGALLWIDDIDLHLYQQQILITDEILADAAWHAHCMATGFYLMSETARVMADESEDATDAELGTAVSLAFAVQSISQYLLAEDVYWITQAMRRNPEEQPLTITA